MALDHSLTMQPVGSTTKSRPDQSRHLVSTVAIPTLRDAGFAVEVKPIASSSRRIPVVEKHADDPTISPSVTRRSTSGDSSLKNLFAVSTSPDVSRNSSYLLPSRALGAGSRNVKVAGTTPLPDHLYTRGLLEGRHSDITVIAFGHRYNLHRLVLDRAPFFASALSEPWLEAHAHEIAVHPEEIDSNITKDAFELSLKRLYGKVDLVREDENAVGLFATGCWLEMQDLVDSAIESILRQMAPDTLPDLINLVTGNYYGRAGDKILASAKAMLCRHGWKMPLRNWDGIPGDIVREIVGGDGFFVDNEWDRWVLTKRLLDRQLRKHAQLSGLIHPTREKKPRRAPGFAILAPIRFSRASESTDNETSYRLPDAVQPWAALYAHQDIIPLLVLLDEGIHYVHFEFEKLQYVKAARDCLGFPVVPEKVITNALWQQMEFRQRIMAAGDDDHILGISHEHRERTTHDHANPEAGSSFPASDQSGSSDKDDSKTTETTDENEGDRSASKGYEDNSAMRKFWIPSSDCNIVMGGNADPVVATSMAESSEVQRNKLLTTVQPDMNTRAADFTSVSSFLRSVSNKDTREYVESTSKIRYTYYPPFRFAVEFPNPRLLKDRKRVYSRTVFYAGSLWNVYIKKISSTRSKQLGVYLHRAKTDEAEDVSSNAAGFAHATVDERIGLLERELNSRHGRPHRRQRPRSSTISDAQEGPGVDSSESGEGSSDLRPGVSVNMDASNSPYSARSSTMRSLLARRPHRRTTSTEIPGSTLHSISAGDPVAQPLAARGNHNSSTHIEQDGKTYHNVDDDSDQNDTEDDEDDLEVKRLAAAHDQFHTSAVPPYIDARPTIWTYFKIYSPSRGGRMLSVYESAPDRFDFAQSWGWRSSSLMLDEGLLGEDDGDATAAVLSGDGIDGNNEGFASGVPGLKNKGDGKLRFMVVIGNI